jgi:DNA polymerase III epsilon subunit-like protein
METTGKESDDRLCQLAFKTKNGLIVNELFDPGRPISIEAMSTHHITNEMIRGKPVFEHSEAYNKLQELTSNENNVIVAHNAQFDISMLEKEGIRSSKVICNLKMARFLDQEGKIPKYNLQYLRYYLNLNIAATAHDALGDILVLEVLFKRIYAKAKELFGDKAAEEMIKISNNPILINRMPYGKHKGIRFTEIPLDYLQWLLTTKLDVDMAYTVRHHLEIGN